MNKKLKTALSIGLFVAFLGIAYLAYTGLSEKVQPSTQAVVPENETTEVEAKNPAPDFTVMDAQGNEVKLSDYLGKPVVLNFWASWCPPCKSEMPHFNETYLEVKDEVVFMMVDLTDGQRETQADGEAYVAENGFEFPVFFDTKMDAANAYGITAIPTSIFIDAEGNIVKTFQGAIDQETLLSTIELIKK